MSEAFIHVEDGLKRVRGNKKLFKRMLSLFLNSEEFAKFDTYMSQKDYKNAAEAAHAIKGLTANLSMTSLSAASEAMMLALRSGSYDEAALKEYQDILEKTRQQARELIDTLDA